MGYPGEFLNGDMKMWVQEMGQEEQEGAKGESKREAGRENPVAYLPTLEREGCFS